MSKSKSNILAGLGLIIALVLAVFLIWKKFSPTDASQTSEYAHLNTSKPSPVLNTKVTADTQVFFTETDNDSDAPKELITTNKEDLADFSNLDTEMQSLFTNIDRNLDQAHRIKEGFKKRDSLLLITEMIIDSALKVYDNPFFNVSMGDLKMLQGKNVEAVKQYEQAMVLLGNIESIRRNHAGACYNAAIDVINKNDTDQAIALMESFNAYAPNDENGRAVLMDWYKKRSVGLLRLGKNRKGLELCKKAMVLDPFEHVAHFNAGIAYFRLNDYEKAIKRFENCLELNANDNYSKNYLYTIYMNKGEAEKAKKYETESINVELPVE